MISLDQVLLLEEKVESAVAKIQQLEAENDALRNKCSELTNALSAKTEQLASFENEQKTIESGIIKAIDRLNSIENSVLKQAGQSAPKPAASGLAASAAAVATNTVAEEKETPAPAPTPTPTPTTDVSFDQMTPVESPEEETFDEEEVIDNPDAIDQAFDEVTIEEPVEEPIEDEIETDSDPESKDQLGFDIF